MSKFIQREKDLLIIFNMILQNEEIYLNDFALEEETLLVDNKKYDYYLKIFNDVLHYCSLVGIHCVYKYDYVMHLYYDFIVDFIHYKNDFINMDEDDKKSFGILNVFLMLRNDVALSKYGIELVYGFKLSSTQLVRIKKEIEEITKRKIITRKDLSYCFERMIR